MMKQPDGIEAGYQRIITTDPQLHTIVERDLHNKSVELSNRPTMDSKQLHETFDYLQKLLSAYIIVHNKPRIRQCEVVDCFQRYHASGMCRYHYDQARRHTSNYIGYDERRRRGERNPRKFDKLRKVRRSQDSKLIHVDQLPEDAEMKFSLFRDGYLTDDNMHVPVPIPASTQINKQIAMVQAGIYACYQSISARYPYIDVNARKTYSQLHEYLIIIHSNIGWHLFCHANNVSKKSRENNISAITPPQFHAAVLLCYRDGFKEEIE